MKHIENQKSLMDMLIYMSEKLKNQTPRTNLEVFVKTLSPFHISLLKMHKKSIEEQEKLPIINNLWKKPERKNNFRKKS